MMNNPIKPAVKIALMSAAVLALAACGNMSRHIAQDGQSAEELVWPDTDATSPLRKQGTHPTMDKLQRMHTGMNKKQVNDLLHAPHFDEGWGVREWTYLFNLDAPDWVPSDAVDAHGEVQCLYKVLFDEHKLAQSFHWHPAYCADIVAGKDDVAPTPQSLTLDADALFAFDSAEIKPEGKTKLREFAHDLQANDVVIERMHITGYTDRFGTADYNQRLSQQRANAVRAYLSQQGVPSSVMVAEGMGESNPLVYCDGAATADVIACLQPNRRVEIEVNAQM